MDAIQLTPQAIELYTDMLSDPKKYDQAYEPINQCFVSSEIPTAKHILFEQYVAYIKKPLPKVIFYIIMDQAYPQGVGPDGCLGYYIKFAL